MTPKQLLLYPDLRDFIENLPAMTISVERKKRLNLLIDYIIEKQKNEEEVCLNFICTHNSRRSQFAQVWAHVAAFLFEIPLKSFSGGVEVTAFNERAIDSLRRSGFKIESNGTENPKYLLHFAENQKPIRAFSKLYDDAENPIKNFAAVMTCSHADENCPFIPGAEKRIALNYLDPKEYDNTSQEETKYDERSVQIASELFYVFRNCSQR